MSLRRARRSSEVGRWTGKPATPLARKPVAVTDDRLFYRVGEAALLAQRAARPTFRHLWDAEFRVYSQWGEDGILEYLCDSLDLVRPRAVEFGAGNFRECNTRFMAERRNAAVVAVDARADLLTSVRTRDLYWRTSIWPIQEWVTPVSAPGLLTRARQTMGGVDVMSLDLDGNDYWVAESLDLDSVQVVVVEYNALGSERAVSVPRNDHFDRRTADATWLHFGASLRAWVHLLGERGFTFLGTNRAASNAFFCSTSRLADVQLPLPGTADLSLYVDSRIRESRGPDGGLSHLAGHERIAAIAHRELIDVKTGDLLTVGEANTLS